MPNGVRLIEIDCSKFCECKIALTFLRTPDFAFDGVPCTQDKFAYLIGRYINIIRASKIIGYRTAQKTTAVGQDLNGAKDNDLLAIFGFDHQDRVHEIRLEQSGRHFQTKLQRYGDEVDGLSTVEV